MNILEFYTPFISREGNKSSRIREVVLSFAVSVALSFVSMTPVFRAGHAMIGIIGSVGMLILLRTVSALWMLSGSERTGDGKRFITGSAWSLTVMFDYLFSFIIAGVT